MKTSKEKNVTSEELLEMMNAIEEKKPKMKAWYRKRRIRAQVQQKFEENENKEIQS